MSRIGIVGCGFVGNAIYQGMKHVYPVHIYDKKWGGELYQIGNECGLKGGLKDCMKDVDGPIFLCLPTPMNPDGTCNTDIIESVVDEIDSWGERRTLVIKSTVIPGTCDRLNANHMNVDVCFNPEFLTERTAVDDFKNQKFIIVGGPTDAVRQVKHVYQRSFPNVPCYKTEAIVAEMVKYTINCFLATRVSFANEIRQICDKANIDYDKVVEYATKDERIGHTHWAVPGPDGHFGFGGSCFIKDLNAMMAFAKNLEIEPEVMMGAWVKNLEVRPERDWEQLKGRAVV